MFSASFLSAIVAAIGLLVWGVKYLISRNKRDVFEAKSIKETLDGIKKANMAKINAMRDANIIKRLREKYNIK